MGFPSRPTFWITPYIHNTANAIEEPEQTCEDEAHMTPQGCLFVGRHTAFQIILHCALVLLSIPDQRTPLNFVDVVQGSGQDDKGSGMVYHFAK